VIQPSSSEFLADGLVASNLLHIFQYSFNLIQLSRLKKLAALQSHRSVYKIFVSKSVKPLDIFGGLITTESLPRHVFLNCEAPATSDQLHKPYRPFYAHLLDPDG
jgi:hypothetical protein